MGDALQRLADALNIAPTPPQWGGVALIILYVIQAEVRFGKKARQNTAEATDRASSIVLSLAMLVPVIGLVWSIEPAVRQHLTFLFNPPLPFAQAFAWAGVAIGLAGLALRLWAVLTLRHRYTRTLLINDNHDIERGGPYALVRHPGYLGSLMTLNGIAATTGAAPLFVLSLIVTILGYLYRVRVEDKMLVDAMGEPYAQYRREVGALLPFLR
jgi:protein-S-isoprenylcysteine O-methyltransferase Ste14